MNLLKKLHQLGTDIREIGLSGDMTQRLAVDAAGEIAGLAENINGMLDALEQSWREVYMNEFRLRHVTENMLDMVSQADARGVFQYLSPSNESILGYKNEEMIGKSVFELMHPDDLDRIMGAFQAAIETGIGRAEFRYRHADGHYLWIETVGKMLFDERGAIAGSVFGSRDISQRKLAEEALLEAEAKYRTIFEASGTATVIIEEDATISLANREFEELSGYSKEEIEGKKSWLDLISPKASEIAKKYHFLRIIEPEAAPKQHESELINKRGEFKNILTKFEIIPGTKKSVVSFLDITERKLSEERLRHLIFHDPLTGICNRSFFEEELKRLSVERQMPLSIIMCDVNGLKLINDTLGHQKGDELIIRAASILTNNCRREDIVCRWAGDEFAILLPMTDREFANKICERIREACKETEKDAIPISFSLGTATKEGTDQNIELVFSEAEDIMYRDKLLDSRSTRFSMINYFQRSLAEKSAETLEHGRRIQNISAKIGEELGLSKKERDELSILATLHDIGQIAMPVELLTKPCYLTADEWQLIKKHPEIGERIARSIPDLSDVADAILSHHEFWDGTGYPQGLKGEQIPLLSRILTIADAYDVMTNGRPYKKAISHEEAVKEIEKCAGTQFDPELVKLFLLYYSF